MTLRQRLDAALARKSKLVADFQAERQALEQRFRRGMTAIESEASAIKSLIDIEEARSGRRRVFVPTLSIKDFLVKTVKESGPKTKEELRDLADEAGYFRHGESAGRATHAQVLDLVNKGRLRFEGDKYHVAPEIAG